MNVKLDLQDIPDQITYYQNEYNKRNYTEKDVEEGKVGELEYSYQLLEKKAILKILDRLQSKLDMENIE